MTNHPSLAQQKGYYRYSTSDLDQKGAARLFPYTGEDGAVHYVLTKLYQKLLAEGKLSVPWILLLTELEKKTKKLEEDWLNIGTFLVDCQIFQSGWFNFNLPPNEQFNSSYIQDRKKLLKQLFAAKTAVSKLDKNLPVRERNAEQRKLFFEALNKVDGVKPPIMVMIHERDGGLSDHEFSRQS